MKELLYEEIDNWENFNFEEYRGIGKEGIDHLFSFVCKKAREEVRKLFLQKKRYIAACCNENEIDYTFIMYKQCHVNQLINRIKEIRHCLKGDGNVMYQKK